MAELSTELLSPADNPRRILDISRVAGSAGLVHTELGIQGWKLLAHISPDGTQPEADAFDPLFVLTAGKMWAQKLPLAVAASVDDDWAHPKSGAVQPATVAIVGSQYLHSLAPLRKYTSEADFRAYEAGLPPATDTYLGPGQAYIGPEVGVMYMAPDLVTVAALGRSTLSVEFASAA